MSHPRGLTLDEADAWETLSATVEPLHAVPAVLGGKSAAPARSVKRQPPKFVKPRRTAPAAAVPPLPVATPSRTGRNPRGNLDSHWDRRLKAGEIAPEFSLDLHGHGLDAAYTRLMRGMMQASATGARVILVVTGKARPVDAADRGTSRGAIRAKILDWLAASEHGDNIAAIRKAHRRHGGEGALYIVLRRSG